MSASKRRSKRAIQRAAQMVEALEGRRYLFNTGGQWNNPDELTFSYINVFDGGIQDSGGNALSDANIRSAIIEGMSVWTGVAPIKITQVPDSGPNPPNDIAYFQFDSRLRFGHHADDGPGGDLAHAWLPDAGSSLAGDVHFDNTESWQIGSTGNTAPWDLIEVAAHEVGHALGMKHDDTFNALMNENYKGRYSGPGTAFLLQDDINGIQSMYGVGLGYVLTDADRLFVSGTNSADTITVEYDSASDELIVTSVGIGNFRIDEDEVLEIVIDARGGDDTVRIISLDGDTTAVVNAGAGNDTINVGGGDLNTNVKSDVTINGGSGTDTLFIRDGDDDGGTYIVTPTSVSKSNSNLVSFTPGDIENVTVVGTEFDDTFDVSGNTSIAGDITIELQGNGGADTFNIDEVDDRADMILLGGLGHDTFNIANGDYDTNIDGNIDIDGGDSGDIINLDDTTDVGADEYILDVGYFERPTGSDGILTYSNVSTFHLDANGADNEINILGVGAGVTTNVNGGGGNDTFNIGDHDYDTNILATLTITGGGGTADRIEVRDDNDSNNDDYFFGVSQTFGYYFDKDTGPILIYDTIEQFYLLANGDNNDIYAGATDLDTDVTLSGFNGDDKFFIGTTDQAVDGDLDLIGGELVIWAGTGNDTVTFDDAGDAPVGLGGLPDSYAVTTTTVSKTIFFPLLTWTFEYNEVENLVLEANSDGNGINVRSTLAGTSATLLGNGGNDSFNLGETDNVAGIDGPVVADGGAGTDKLNYNDSAATQDRTYTVSPTEISRTNVAVTTPLVEEIVVNAGTGNDTINVTANIPTTVNGGEGNDTINAAGGDWDHGVIADLAVDGGAGSDFVLIDDTADGGTDAYDLTETVASKSTPFANPITYTTIESLELAANSEANLIQVTSTFDGDVKVRGRGGADQIVVVETFPGRPVTVEGGPDLDEVRVNANGVGTAGVQFETSQDLSALIIGAGGSATLLAHGERSIYTQSLGMTSTSVLNLADNYMVLDYTGVSPIAAVRTLLTSGYAGGAWNGNGINSSVAASTGNTAVGYAEASELFTTFPATFAGLSVDNTDILLAHTLYGDADLNRNVNLGDFNRLAANFGQSPRGWAQGNFDFNGTVNLADFNLLAANFGGTALPAPPGATGGSSDDPSTDDQREGSERLPGLSDLLL